MEAANERWQQKQEEIEQAGLSEQARADLEAMKDQIDDDICKMLLAWLDRGELEYLRLAEQKIESLADFHRMTWGRVGLPEEGSGEGLDEFE